MTQTNGKNTDTQKEFMKRVAVFGEEAAKGKDSLPKLGLAVLQASNEGLLDNDVWPPVAGKDAVAQIYAKYAEGARKTVHDHAPDSLKAQESKLRAFFRAGKHIQHGLDPVIEMDRVREKREELFNKDPKAVRPAYSAYYAGALAILNTQGSALTTGEIEAAVYKPTPKDKTIAEELRRIYKATENLVTGDKGLKHSNENMIDVVEKLREELEELGVDPDASKKKKDKNAPQPMGPGGEVDADAALAAAGIDVDALAGATPAGSA